MSLGVNCWFRNLFKTYLVQNVKFSTELPKIKKNQLLISCKRKNLDHYSLSSYNKLDEVPLASKGWNHSKSKGDFFTVHPMNDDEELTYSFSELGLHTNIVDVLKNEGIIKATDFQYRAIPTIQSGTHTMLAAETGCGKTIAYLLPLIQSLVGNKAKSLNTPKAIVIVPSRELAYQIGETAQTLAEAVGVNVKILVGGQTKRLMLNPVFEEIDILVATPGALGKLSTVGIYKLNEVQYTVLDEADTLIDDSFIERIGTILKRVSQSQIMLVTATLPRKLPDVLVPIESTLKHVVSPNVHKPLLNITQKFLKLTHSSKPANLLQIAKSNKTPMIIFSNRNETCNWVSLFLNENNIKCVNINGNMNHAIRIDQWNQFVRGEANILSATDVGSRGLNTIQVKHVLNYEFPLYAANYIHRIGRVGRLGSPASCKVTNLVSGSQEIQLVQQIELAVRKNQQLANVDGNITNIVQRKIARQMRQTVRY